jgi:DNA-directed RNA polymerase subunit RPC12/RpoP
MFMNVTCPTCGHKCRVAERALGQQVQCPACLKSFQCGSTSPPSLATHPAPAETPPPVQAVPQARAIQVQPDQAIHYCCPRCTRPLESPGHLAGQKVHCPDCGQRLQVPQPAAPPPSSAVHQALPAAAGGSAPAVPQAPPSRPRPPCPAPALEVILEVVPAASPAPAVRRDYCLECGADVTQRPRLQTCPDCGSLFCSAKCYREHRYHAHPSRR